MSTLSLSHAGAFSSSFASAPVTRKVARPVITPDQATPAYAKAISFGTRAAIAASLFGLQFWIFFAH